MRSTISKIFSRRSPTKILRKIALEAKKNMYSTAALKEEQKPYDRINAYRNIIKANRPDTRKNPDGSESTVILADAEYDGRFFAHPMLFPGYDNKELEETEEWHEFKKGEEDLAFDEAVKRGEVFEFPTAEEAQEFAEGNWKDKNNYVIYDNDSLSSSKAKKMLEDGKINGEPLTDKQKRYFGWIAGGKK
tara:strand:+ start:952 stop:1521 length:570 start_codon:yes stop_codon:yes gene_type:complete